MRGVLWLLVPLLLAGCAAAPPREAAAPGNLAPSEAAPRPVGHFDVHGSWTAQAAGRSFVGSGYPVVRIPGQATGGSLVVRQTATSVDEMVVRFKARDESVVWEKGLQGSETKIALAAADLQALAKSFIVNVEPSAGASAQVDFEVVGDFTT